MKRKIFSVLVLVSSLSFAACNNSTKSTDSGNVVVEGTDTEELPETITDTNENGSSSMIGKFSYYADAATFEDCENGVRYSVQPDAGEYKQGDKYLELERYYLSKATEAGIPIYVVLEGHLTKKDEAEEGLEDIIVPTKFSEIEKEKTDCKE